MIIKELFARLGLDFEDSGFSKAELAIDAVKASLVGLGGIVVAAGGVLAAMIHEVAGTAGDMNNAAQAIGISAERLQELGYAAQFGGAGVEEISAAMIFLAKKGVKDADAELMRIADRLAKMPSDSERTAYAIEALGKAGARLVPALKDGAGAIEKLAAEAREAGFVISDDLLAAGVDLGDTRDAIKAALKGIRNAIVADLLPATRDAAHEVLDWIRANRGLIRQRLVDVFRAVATALRILWSIMVGIVDAAKFVYRWFDLIATIMGSALLAAIVANSGALGIMGLQALVVGNWMLAAALKALGAWMAAALPFVIIAAKIALLILIVEDLYQLFTGGESLIGELAEAWAHFYDEWLNEPSDFWLINLLKSVLKFFADLGTEIPAAIDFWVGLFTEFGQSLGRFFGGIADWITEKVQTFVGWIKGPIDALSEKVRALAGWIGGGTKAISEGVQGAVGFFTGRKADGTPADDAASMQSTIADPVGSRFARGAVPESSPAQSVNVSKPPVVAAPQFAATFNVTAAPGQSPEEVAGQSREQFDEWFASNMSRTMSSVAR